MYKVIVDSYARPSEPFEFEFSSYREAIIFYEEQVREEVGALLRGRAIEGRQFQVTLFDADGTPKYKFESRSVII